MPREVLPYSDPQTMSLAKDFRKAKNTIKDLLLFHGVKVPEHDDNPNWSETIIN